MSCRSACPLFDPNEIVQRANPTDILIARPNALILYATLAKGPKLPLEYQVNSSRHSMRELNRLGITSAIDAGGGFQNYPEDYQVIEGLHKNGELTVRIAYNLFTQKPKGEPADFQNWTSMLSPRQGDDHFRHNGAGEMLVFSAADFEDFLEPRPDMPGVMEQELKPVVSLLAKNRWPFRLHATCDETITRALNVYKEVNREVPLQGLHWYIDNAETISQRNRDRIAALGGGIAIQHRLSFWRSCDIGFSKPPIRAQKTREANERARKHLQATFGSWRLVDVTADDIEQYLRARLKKRARVKIRGGFRELGILKATTVHQEFRVLRRALNVAARKEFLPANPCSGVEFPVSLRGLFRPHYVKWSEQQVIEFHAPDYLRNVVRIITETGLRVYKELTPMKKDQVDLENAVVWIPDSKTPTGIAEVPLTSLAVQAFQNQLRIAGPGIYLFPSDKNPSGHPRP